MAKKTPEERAEEYRASVQNYAQEHGVSTEEAEQKIRERAAAAKAQSRAQNVSTAEDAKKAANLETAQQHLDGMRREMTTAERDYATITLDYEKLRSAQPDAAESSLVKQAITTRFGKEGGAKIEQHIIRDAYNGHVAKMGDHLIQASEQLEKAGLQELASKLIGSENKHIELMVDLRHELVHPNRSQKRQKDASVPDIAKKAEPALNSLVDEVKNTPFPPEKEALKAQILEKIESAGKENQILATTSPTEPRPLLASDLTAATEMKEIRAGGYGGPIKALMKKSGYQMEQHRFPHQPANDPPVLVFPNTTPGEHPVDMAQNRRDNLSHGRADSPEPPGALERTRTGDTIHDKLPPTLDQLHAAPPVRQQGQGTQQAQAPSTNTDIATAQTPPAEPPVQQAPASALSSAAENVPEVAAGASRLAPVVKYGGAALMGAGVAVEAGTEGYHAYKDGKGAGAIAGAATVGALKGAVDTVAPGLRTGYDDVIGQKDMTRFDRMLNAAHDATGTVTMGATGVTMAGVETGPFDLGPAAVAGVAGIANLGTNLLKAGVKVTGMAGKDQDGGYVYEGIVGGYELAKAGVIKLGHLISGGEDVHPSAPPVSSKTQMTPATAPETVTQQQHR